METPKFKQVTETEITLANLIKMRQQLDLEIQRLRSTLPQRTSKRVSTFIDPRTKKKVQIRKVSQ